MTNFASNIKNFASELVQKSEEAARIASIREIEEKTRITVFEGREAYLIVEMAKLEMEKDPRRGYLEIYKIRSEDVAPKSSFSTLVHDHEQEGLKEKDLLSVRARNIFSLLRNEGFEPTIKYHEESRGCASHTVKSWNDIVVKW